MKTKRKSGLVKYGFPVNREFSIIHGKIKQEKDGFLVINKVVSENKQKKLSR